MVELTPPYPRQTLPRPRVYHRNRAKAQQRKTNHHLRTNLNPNNRVKTGTQKRGGNDCHENENYRFLMTRVGTKIRLLVHAFRVRSSDLAVYSIL